MKTQRTVYLKFEEMEQCSGVLTLVSPEGVELISSHVDFRGNTYNTLGLVAKHFVERAAHVY